VNTPYFSDYAGNHFNEAAIFWFGKVSPTENYADLRFAYDDDILWVTSLRLTKTYGMTQVPPAIPYLILTVPLYK
jgi:hypothetical protein